MAAAKKPRPKKSVALTPDEIAKLDLDPEAWPKFEKLVKSAAKRDHQPHSQQKHQKDS